jgi:hypothetical protein
MTINQIQQAIKSKNMLYKQYKSLSAKYRRRNNKAKSRFYTKKANDVYSQILGLKKKLARAQRSSFNYQVAQQSSAPAISQSPTPFVSTQPAISQSPTPFVSTQPAISQSLTPFVSTQPAEFQAYTTSPVFQPTTAPVMETEEGTVSVTEISPDESLEFTADDDLLLDDELDSGFDLMTFIEENKVAVGIGAAVAAYMLFFRDKRRSNPLKKLFKSKKRKTRKNKKRRGYSRNRRRSGYHRNRK